MTGPPPDPTSTPQFMTRRTNPPAPTRPHPARRGEAARLVPVTWAQLQFLVDGDPARLAPLRHRAVATADADVVRLIEVDLRALSEAWVATYGGDRQPGFDCEPPAWTPALAELAARRMAAADAVAQAVMDTVDYLVSGRAVPIRNLLASVRSPGVGPGASGDQGISCPVPTADPRVTQCADDLRELAAVYDVADADYRVAVRQAVNGAPAIRSADP